MTAPTLALVLAYLLGSLPTGYLLVLAFHRTDIRSVGSGNIGATNVARSGSKALGIATLLIDLAKGYAAVAIARLIALHTGADANQLASLAALLAIAGHVFPVWLKFRGGKGVATALGVFLALSPLAALSLLAVFAVVFALTRIVSISSIAASISFFYVGTHFMHGVLTGTARAALYAIPVLIIVKHHQNISRLLRGAEPRFTLARKENA
jgi:glycerol-3-phosphate acyltransferase PlsY